MRTPHVGFLGKPRVGFCGLNGENCTTVDISLTNTVPTDPGSGSSAAIDLIPPHAFSIITGFVYFDGCDGAGEDCIDPGNCMIPGTLPYDMPVPVRCQADNVNIAITFCD